MDVTRPAPHRVGEKTVDELHHRRIIRKRHAGVVLFLLLHDLEILVSHTFEKTLQLCVGLLVVFLNRGPQRVLARYHRHDVAPGDELEIVDDLHVARLRHGDGQAAAVPLQRQDRMLQSHIGWNKLDDLFVYLELRQIDRRHVILAGQHLGDLDLQNKAQLHQDVTQPGTRTALLAQRLLELLLRDQAITDQQVSYSQTADSGCHHVGLEAGK